MICHFNKWESSRGLGSSNYGAWVERKKTHIMYHSDFYDILLTIIVVQVLSSAPYSPLNLFSKLL
jgi:hypothetical protein